MLLRRSLLICTALLVVACGDSNTTNTPSPSTPTPLVAVPFQQMIDIPYRLITTLGNAAAGNQTTWTTLWSTAFGSTASAPTVDFNKNMVVAVFATGSDGCSGLEITQVLQNEVSTVVKYRVRSQTNPAVQCIQIISSLAAFATVPKQSDGLINVSFVAE